MAWTEITYQCGHTSVPPLEGSPRQIAWAETLRQQQIALLSPAIDYACATDPDFGPATGLAEAVARVQQRFVTVGQRIPPGAVPALRLALEAIAGEIRAETDASWWIDQREHASEPRGYLRVLYARGRAEIDALLASAAEVAQ